jgi:hypothetical protein
MAHYAELDENNIVLRVIVVRNQDTLDENGNESETVANDFLHANGITGRFIRTSYNTRGNVHYDPKTNEPSGKVAFRKNYAGIGMTYDPSRDAFISQKPEDPNTPDRYVFDENTFLWGDTLRRNIEIGVTRI